MVVDAVAAPTSEATYGHALGQLFAFAGGRPLSRAVLNEWRSSMEGLAASTINVRLSAVRRLVAEARHAGTLDAEEAARLTDVPNMRERGTRLGNWLTKEQARELLTVPDRQTLKGKRDYAMLGLLVGCALRRRELAALDIAEIQLRENRWVIVDLRGKGGRVRTVAVPLWVRHAINAWQAAAGIEDGPLLRRSARRQSRSKPQRLGGLGHRPAGGARDRDRELRRPRLPPHLCQALPEGRRRSRRDQVPARSLVDPDHRTVSRLRTRDRGGGQRCDRAVTRGWQRK